MNFTRHYPHWPKHLPKQLILPDTGLYANLEIAALRYAQRPAMEFYGTRLSYAELHAQAESLAGYLQQRLAVARGDRVVLYTQNCPQFVIAFYALMRIGAVAVPVNPMNVSAELRDKVSDCGARVLIAAQELVEHVRVLLSEGALAHIVVVHYGEYLDAADHVHAPALVTAPPVPVADRGCVAWSAAIKAGLQPQSAAGQPDELCLILYTSGTTGEGKGCVHTHHSVMATTVGAVMWSQMSAEAVVLNSVPLFHVTGLQHCMNATIYAGAKLVIMTRWDKDVALDVIARQRVTHWTNIPTMVVDVLSSPKALEMDWSSLRFIGGGGASMPEAIAQRLLDLSGLFYLEGFGSTESISQTHWNPAQRPKKQCLGIPVFDTDSRVIDPDSLRELGPGETGEIISSGPQIMQGYWNKPEATRESFIEIDGKRFFRTGDLGRYDEEGYFFIVDRLKRMINAAGFKVWPAEVEATLYAHPAIQEACVISVPDARRGESVKALIVLKQGHGNTSAQDIIDWARQQMSAYKVPRAVQFVDSLPKTASGKIQWRLLQEKEWRSG